MVGVARVCGLMLILMLLLVVVMGIHRAVVVVYTLKV